MYLFDFISGCNLFIADNGIAADGRSYKKRKRLYKVAKSRRGKMLSTMSLQF